MLFTKSRRVCEPENFRVTITNNKHETSTYSFSNDIEALNFMGATINDIINGTDGKTWCQLKADSPFNQYLTVENLGTFTFECAPVK